MKTQHHLIVLLALILLAACSSNQTLELQTSQNKPQDSEPTHGSMYFYMAGTMQYNLEEYKAAMTLYQHALGFDPKSLTIKRQMLLSAMQDYNQNPADSVEVRKLVDANLPTVAKDPALLDAAYSFFYQLGDIERSRWALDVMLKNYPSVRAYILNFFYYYQNEQRIDLSLLQPALQLAQNDAAQLLMLSELFDMVDPSSALQAVKRLYQIEPNTDNAQLVATRIVSSEDQNQEAAYFNSLKYPDDIELIYNILNEYLQEGKLDFLNLVSPAVLATKDPELIYLLALSALLSQQDKILVQAESSITENHSEVEETQYIRSLIIARSLLNDESRDLKPLFAQLDGTEHLDNVIRFYFLSVGSTMQDPEADIPDSVYEDLVARLKQRLPEGNMRRYLIASIQAIPDDSPAMLEQYQKTKADLIEEWMKAGIYSPEDINWMLGHYYQSGQKDKRIPLLKLGLELFPDQDSWYNDLGYNYLIRGENIQEAGELIFKALALNPENLFYLDSIAWYYYLVHDYEHAMEYAAYLMDMEKMPSEIAYHIALIHMKVNDFDTAIRFMRLAAGADDDAEYQEKARRALGIWESE